MVSKQAIERFVPFSQQVSPLRSAEEEVVAENEGLASWMVSRSSDTFGRAEAPPSTTSKKDATTASLPTPPKTDDIKASLTATPNNVVVSGPESPALSTVASSSDSWVTAEAPFPPTPKNPVATGQQSPALSTATSSSSSSVGSAASGSTLCFNLPATKVVQPPPGFEYLDARQIFDTPTGYSAGPDTFGTEVIQPPPGFERLGERRILKTTAGLGQSGFQNITQFPEPFRPTDVDKDGAPSVAVNAARADQQKGDGASGEEKTVEQDVVAKSPISAGVARHRQDFELARSFDSEDDLIFCGRSLLEPSDLRILDGRKQKATEADVHERRIRRERILNARKASGRFNNRVPHYDRVQSLIALNDLAGLRGPNKALHAANHYAHMGAACLLHRDGMMGPFGQFPGQSDQSPGQSGQFFGQFGQSSGQCGHLPGQSDGTNFQNPNTGAIGASYVACPSGHFYGGFQGYNNGSASNTPGHFPHGYHSTTVSRAPAGLGHWSAPPTVATLARNCNANAPRSNSQSTFEPQTDAAPLDVLSLCIPVRCISAQCRAIGDIYVVLGSFCTVCGMKAIKVPRG